MVRGSYHDQFADEEPASMAPSARLSPIPAPPRTPIPLAPPMPPRGREREVQQLIHDLAVLAAKNDPPNR